MSDASDDLRAIVPKFARKSSEASDIETLIAVSRAATTGPKRSTTWVVTIAGVESAGRAMTFGSEGIEGSTCGVGGVGTVGTAIAGSAGSGVKGASGANGAISATGTCDASADSG